MTAPLAPIRRRTSWTVEHEAAVVDLTVVPLPEPMPATRVTYRSPLIWRAVGYAFLFQTVIVASVVFFAACAVWAIIGGLAVMGVGFQ